ncbi:MAG: maleylacetoacetate isomerase [Legionella sp.]|nr:MAG: maleylacetoacetate isomerase [Legionella sp.]
MQLYDYYRSSCSYRVRIALEIKQLDYDIVSIDLTQDAQHTPSYQARNPQRLVPTLVDQNQSLTQSLAIIEYLNECYPTPPLLPDSLFERAKVRALGLIVACDMHPLNNLRVLNTLRHDWDADEGQVLQWYHQWLEEGFGAIEQQLAAYQRKQLFCYADHVTLADICLVPQVYNAKRFEFPLEKYPLIQAISTHCNTLPAFINAYPKQNDTQ